MSGAALAATVIVLGLIGSLTSRAATPPPLVNYQGVLRDQNDKPLSGAYDMLLRFMDAETAGNEIMIDQHASVTGNGVFVSGGLFNVALGSGTITDGSGPGTYTSLDAVFRDYGSVWLEVRVGAETLSPRTPIQSAPYAFNATSAANATLLNGQPASSFIDLSATRQTKNGGLNLRNTDSFGIALDARNDTPNGVGINGSGGTYGVEASASNGTGGLFQGHDYGVWAYGNTYAGGLFIGQNNADGVSATAGTGEAGKFVSTNSYAPRADLAYSNTGVSGACSTYGGNGVVGSGERLGVYGYASGAFAGGAKGGKFAADGAFSVGVDAAGATGGHFSSTVVPGLSVNLADSSIGVNVTGGSYGGYFQTTAAGSTGLYASAVNTGINATGGSYGGQFQANNSGSTGVIVSGVDTGISATGQSRGGYFADSGVERASLATGGFGITASGSSVASYFSNGSPWFAYTQIPYQGDGIYAYGSSAGGEFRAFGTGNYAYVATGIYKIQGTGIVSFVQNHPTDPSKVIVYAAPEGDEAAVYTRGSGRLVNGEGRVALGSTFALVTNPDIGLTATATPRGEPIPLAVSEVSPGELVVRGPAGSDAEFDYMVWGLRIGFEETAVVQPKRDESKIPSMHEHEQFFKDDPGLRNYTALARFSGVEEAVHGRKQVEFSRADRLRDAVGVSPYSESAAGATHATDRVVGAPQPTPGPEPASAPPAATPLTAPGPDPRNPAEAPANRPAIVLDLFAAEGTIEAGDVVSLAPETPGAVARSVGPNDALVIGCAQAGETGFAAAGQVAVATSHIALCRVDASYGAISVGDRLTPSPAPGLAMEADHGAAGSIILGRAIDPLPSGVGLVRVLLGAR